MAHCVDSARLSFREGRSLVFRYSSRQKDGVEFGPTHVDSSALRAAS